MADIIPIDDHWFTETRELRTLDGRWYWDARVWTTRDGDLVDGREYSVRRLAEEFGLPTCEGRPFLPLPEGLTRMPVTLRFVVLPL